MTFKLWAYTDAHNWGSMLAKAAEARGHDVHLFDSPRQPDEGFVFMHMHHHPQVRTLHKRVMALMAMNPNLTLIPEYRSSVLYDDKIEQSKQLAAWMPRTELFFTPGAARRFLDRNPLPLISKTSEGASSHNVRFIQTMDEAQAEVKQAFSDLGIKCKYGQQQRGYLLWQKFIEGNAGDIRIIAIGTKRLILKRGNRDNRPMASGSGRLTPVTGPLTDNDVLGALVCANKFFDVENFNWCGIDLVKDQKTGRWYVLETTVGWTLHGYYECEFYDLANKPTGRMGLDVWNVLIDEIEAGVFSRA